MSTASLAADSSSPPSRRTSSIRYSWTTRPPLRTFSTPASNSLGSMPDMNPTLPRFTPSRTRSGYILAALSMVPSPPSTKTRSGSTAPSGSPWGLTSATSTPPRSSAAPSRSECPSSTRGFATIATRLTRPAPIFSATCHDLPRARLVHRRPRAPDQVHRELLVAGLPPGNSRGRQVHGAKPEGSEQPHDVQDRGGPDRRVADEAAAAYQIRSRLELGLDEDERLPQRGRRGEQRPQRDPERDKREVGHQKIGGKGQILAPQMPHVCPLEYSDLLVLAQRPVELAVPDVHGDHPPRPALEEDVREAAGRCAGIQARPSLDVYPKIVEGSVEFLPRPGDETVTLNHRERLDPVGKAR